MSVSHRASCQAIVLSHEDAVPQCTIPYLGCRLRPLPVLEVLGRSAKREPTCKPSEAVFYWWKDESRVPPVPCHEVTQPDTMLQTVCLRK